MKKICAFVVAILLAAPIFAQSEKGYVYLKNGSILKGKYQFTADSAKLQINSAGNFWIFDHNEIDRVSGNRSGKLDKIAQTDFSSPFFIRTEIGVLAGSSENSQSAPLSFGASLNYKLQPKIVLGAGFGLEFLKETYMPLFLDFEYKIRDSYATPYLFLKTGYQLPMQKSREIYSENYWPPTSSFWPGPNYMTTKMETQGGFLINPGLGYQRMYSANFGLSFAFGYQFTRLYYKGENDYKQELDYNRLTIKLGIIFN